MKFIKLLVMDGFVLPLLASIPVLLMKYIFGIDEVIFFILLAISVLTTIFLYHKK